MTRITTAATNVAAMAAIAAIGLVAQPARAASDLWAAYLDYAYVYSSAEPSALAERLEEYASKADIPLADYVAENFGRRGGDLSEVETRRKAVAYLLHYISAADPTSLWSAVSTISSLKGEMEQNETRYWYHYIHAHEALEVGNSRSFVNHVLALWRTVVTPLETPFETYRTLALGRRASSEFVAGIPYLYENVARLILFRSQRMGVDHGLDPLAAILRSLRDGRIGAHPDVIARDASSRDYVDLIVRRLDGPYSDGGSLSFTLALFEAEKHHERARGLLAGEGFSEATLEAIRVAGGATARAIELADTLQGQTAAYTRALRQLGEIYAAKQRLGVEPQIDLPFHIDRAIDVYEKLAGFIDGGWENQGFRESGRQSYLDAMHGLWAEIQEASFNEADYFLARGAGDTGIDSDSLDRAVSIYARYLNLFERYASEATVEAVPASAYFAAYRAARGAGDAALLRESDAPSQARTRLAFQRYQQALGLFPFDPGVWASAAIALERQGRGSDFLASVKPIAERVSSSRSLDAWIRQDKAEANDLDAMRDALSNDLATLYLGFADPESHVELGEGLAALRERRGEIEIELAEARSEQESLRIAQRQALDAEDDIGPPAVSSAGPSFRENPEISAIARRIDELGNEQRELDEQIAVRARALPLFEDALTANDLWQEIAGQRNHAIHSLLRRLFYENTESAGR